MEREACIFDATVCFRLVQEVCHTQFFDIVPQLADKGMDEVIVNVIGVEFCKLGIEELVHILPLFDKPGREFCRKPDFFAVAVCKGTAHERLALSPVVGPGSVNVVYPVVDCVPYLLYGPFIIDRAIPFHGKPHAPEPEDGKFVPGLWNFPVQHFFTRFLVSDNQHSFPDSMGCHFFALIPMSRSHPATSSCAFFTSPPWMARPSGTVDCGHIFLISATLRPSPLPSCVQNGAMVLPEKS